jgi:hypothetical protein
VCERADGDDVDAGFRERADVAEVDAAARFEDDPATGPADGLRGERRREVVDEDDLGPGGHCRIEPFEVLHLDLDAQDVRCVGARPRHGLGDATPDREVVVFDEHAAIEGRAVIVGAPRADGVFVQHPPAGQRLAGVGDARPRPGDGVDVAPGLRCDAAHPLQEIQHRPFEDEQLAHAAVEVRDGPSGIHDRAVFGGPLDARGLTAEADEQPIDDRAPTQDEALTGLEYGAAPSACGDGEFGGDVTHADVLGEGQVDEGVEMRGRPEHGSGYHEPPSPGKAPGGRCVAAGLRDSVADLHDDRFTVLLETTGLALALGFLAAPTALFDATAKAPASAAAADPKAVLARAREIQKRVEALRSQKLSKPLRMGVKAKPAITRFIQERLAEEYGPAKVAAEGQMLKLVGLLPPTLDYGGFLTQLLTEQVAGFYDHTRQELHIADWIPSFMQDPVLAHEIFHAVQDQEWGGGKLIDSKKYSHDAVQAHAALLEGDATIVMLLYAMSDADGNAPDLPNASLTMVAMTIPLQMSSPEYPVMASAPDYLKQSLIFPYQQGLMFLGSLRQAGWSFADFRKLYADPPSSTEQILHPERYAPTRDTPSEVTVSARPGFTRPWEGTAGELHLKQLLLTGLPADRATNAAAGWDGDFTALEVGGGRAVVHATIAWDAAADAAEFATAARDNHAARKGGPPVTLEIATVGAVTYAAWSEDAALARETVAGLPARSKVVTR